MYWTSTCPHKHWVTSWKEAGLSLSNGNYRQRDFIHTAVLWTSVVLFWGTLKHGPPLKKHSELTYFVNWHRSLFPLMFCGWFFSCDRWRLISSFRVGKPFWFARHCTRQWGYSRREDVVIFCYLICHRKSISSWPLIREWCSRFCICDILVFRSITVTAVMQVRIDYPFSQLSRASFLILWALHLRWYFLPSILENPSKTLVNFL